MPIHVDAEPLADLEVYKLLTSIIIDGTLIPKGYLWDGASIPRVFWPIVGSPFDPKLMAPSLYHDFKYDVGLGARKDADLGFRKLLIVNGVSKSRAKVMYFAVRLGGKGRWNGS